MTLSNSTPRYIMGKKKKNDFTSTFPENLPGPCNAKIEVVRLFRVSLFLLIIRSGVAVATSSWLVIAGKTG